MGANDGNTHGVPRGTALLGAVGSVMQFQRVSYSPLQLYIYMNEVIA